MKLKRFGLLMGLLASLQVGNSCYGAPAHAGNTGTVKPHIDLAFCIDTTSSMGPEIENVKTKMKEIVAKIAGGKPAPVIRVGLVAYRDRGDDYVTKVFPFSEDIDKVVKDISSLEARGGGDAPESVNEALHVAVNDLKWDGGKKTLKMLFLIGDAPPHYYPNDYNYNDESKKAIANGIMINTIGCLGLGDGRDSAGIKVWQTIAKLTDGKYEPLAYKQEIVNADGSRSAVLNSGGTLYRFKDASAAKEWRLGASALAASGKAEKIVASPSYAASASAAMIIDDRPTVHDFREASAGGSAAVAGRLMSSRKAMAGASPAMAKFARPGYSSYVGGSRAENNLADIVLDATKTAANKKLNVDFKEK